MYRTGHYGAALLTYAPVGAVALAGTAAPGRAVSLGAVGFLAGFLVVASHLLADALTPAGIEPFWPFSSENYSLGLVRADSIVGNYGLLALGVFATAVVLLLAGRLDQVFVA
jgi:inner membrane protein